MFSRDTSQKSTELPSLEHILYVMLWISDRYDRVYEVCLLEILCLSALVIMVALKACLPKPTETVGLKYIFVCYDAR